MQQLLAACSPVDVLAASVAVNPQHHAVDNQFNATAQLLLLSVGHAHSSHHSTFMRLLAGAPASKCAFMVHALCACPWLLCRQEARGLGKRELLSIVCYWMA